MTGRTLSIPRMYAAAKRATRRMCKRHKRRIPDQPTRVACGACHDDVNFTTGVNHAGGPQVSEPVRQLHIPQGEIDFGTRRSKRARRSHRIGHAFRSRDSPTRLLAEPLEQAGSRFYNQEHQGKPIALTDLGLELHHGRPHHRLRDHQIRQRRDHARYVSESALKTPSCGSDGSCLYTFTSRRFQPDAHELLASAWNPAGPKFVKGTTKNKA